MTRTTFGPRALPAGERTTGYRVAGVLRRRMVSAYRRTRERLAGPPEGSLAAWLAADPARAQVGADTRLGAVTMLGRARDRVDLRIGDQCDLEGTWFVHEPGARIHIGSRSELNGGCFLDVVEGLEIGSDVLVAAEVYLADHDSHSADWELRRHDHLARRTGSRDWSVVPRAPVRIEDRAWIGRRAMVFKGVTIGEGAIVAAGSIVTSSVPPW